MNSTVTREPLLAADDVSVRLGIPPSTLADWRYQGLGPRYLRIGRHVRYEPAEVDDRLGKQRVRQRGSVP